LNSRRSESKQMALPPFCNLVFLVFSRNTFSKCSLTRKVSAVGQLFLKYKI